MKYLSLFIILLYMVSFVEGTDFIAECQNKVWLQNQSDIVIEGTVKKIEGKTISGETFTFITLNVNKYIKSEGTEEIIVRQLGYLEGGPVVLSITLEYSIGEKVRLYLEKAEGTEYYQTVCGEYGKISLGTAEKKIEKKKPEININKRSYGVKGFFANFFDWLKGLFF
ncbi:MAG: hypothetical protein AABY07_06640 [Nanoarchaeota archaeon]